MENIKKWGSLVVLGLALAIIIIDTTLLNVSLSTIIRELHTNIQSLQWVITAYSLTLAALTITGGRLGDFFGRKKMFMAGAAIFALGSFIASISNSVGVLLTGESIIEGIGAALMMPATASLLIANFHGKERAMAFGIWGGIAGASSAIGPILGGYLTNNYSWRWGFRINVVIAALLLIGSLIVKESRDTEEKPKLDIVGVLLSGIGLAAIVFGFVESSDYGWLAAKKSFELFGSSIGVFGLSITPLSLIVGAVLLILFGLWEKRVERAGGTPLVSLSIFKNRAFTSGVLTTAIVTLGQVGMIFALPVFLQSVLKLDAYQTGLALLPLSITLFFAAPISSFFSTKIPAKFIILAGLLIDIVGILIIRQSISITTTTWDLVPGLALFGVGMGMVMAQISNITLSAVPVYQAGEASGINNTMRQIGSSLGSAIIGAVLLSSLSTNLGLGIRVSTNIPLAMKAPLSKAVLAQSSNVEFGSQSSLQKTLPPQIVTEIENISKAATVRSARESLLIAAIFAFFGLLAACSLPNKKMSGNKPEGEPTPAAGGH